MPAWSRRAARVVLPGVGTFGAAVAGLREAGLDEAIAARVRAGRPTLAMCVGLQVLFEESDESPGSIGLSAIEGRVGAFPATVRVPQFGWNRIEPEPGCRYLAPGYAYFANSYRVLDRARLPDRDRSSMAGASSPRSSAIDVVACQFHPELSGAYGHQLIARWLEGADGAHMRRQIEGSLMPHALLDGRRSLMLARRIIPCLDVSHGRVVKGIRFQGLRDAGDPAERAALYEAQGADEIVILDVSATPEGRGNQVETVRRVRAGLGIPLTVGGGIRTAEDARALLEAGADKVSVNTAAVQRPALLGEIAERFGRQCTVLAIDAARAGDGFEVLVKGGREGTGIDAVQWAHDAHARGRRRDPADQLGPRRHALGLRSRADPRGRRARCASR